MIHIRSVTAESTPDSFEKGEYGMTTQVFGGRDMCVVRTDRGFNTAREAIEAVCGELCFDFIPNNWEIDEFDPDTDRENGVTRYLTSFTVDDDNSEPGESKLAAWRRGECDLYSMRVSVELEYRTTRALYDEEAKLN